MDLTPNAKELLAFVSPQGRVFKWKVTPFGVGNAPALFQELMNKILSILQRRPKVQELISRGAQMEAHIDDVCLGTNTREDHWSRVSQCLAITEEMKFYITKITGNNFHVFRSSMRSWMISRTSRCRSSPSAAAIT